MGNTSGWAASADLHRFLLAAVNTTAGGLIGLAAQQAGDPLTSAGWARNYRNVFTISAWTPDLHPAGGIIWTGDGRSIVDVAVSDGPAGGGQAERHARRLLADPERPEVVRLVCLGQPAESLVIPSAKAPAFVLFETG
jgi:hypothetical protein